MSMSTKIDDLPGPIPDDVKNDINALQGQLKNNLQLQQVQQQPKQQIPEQNLQIDNSNTNITLAIQKKSTPEKENASGLFSIIKNEINEDNLLLCIVIFMGTYPPLTNYVRKIPFLGNYASGDIMSGLIKTFVLIILYIIAKVYILPRIRI